MDRYSIGQIRMQHLDCVFRCLSSKPFSNLDDGSYVDVPRKYDEWVVRSQCYTLEELEKDIAAKVNWGSNQ